MNFALKIITFALALGVGLVAAQPARADTFDGHPEYVHALNDLRYAHWLLRFPAEWNVTAHERAAAGYIDRAYRDVRTAGLDDGKNVDAAFPVDTSLSHRDRLERAIVSLERAHRDIDGWESDPSARGPRGAANGDINAAVVQVRQALRDQRRDHRFGY